MDRKRLFYDSLGLGESNDSSKLEDYGLNTGQYLGDESSVFKDVKILKNIGKLSSCFEDANQEVLNLSGNQEDLTEDILNLKKSLVSLMSDVSCYSCQSSRHMNKLEKLENVCLKNKRKIKKMKLRVRSQEAKITKIENTLMGYPCCLSPSSKFYKKYMKIFFYNKEILPELTFKRSSIRKITVNSTKSNTPQFLKRKILVK